MTNCIQFEAYRDILHFFIIFLPLIPLVTLVIAHLLDIRQQLGRISKPLRQIIIDYALYLKKGILAEVIKAGFFCLSLNIERIVLHTQVVDYKLVMDGGVIDKRIVDALNPTYVEGAANVGDVAIIDNAP